MADQNQIPPNFLTVNRKNFYEISWKIRRQVALDFLANNPGARLAEILDVLEEFENRHLCRLEIVGSDKDSAIGEQYFYTGKAEVKNLPEPDAGEVKALFRSRAYAKKISEIVSAYKFGPFDLIAELGAGYGLNLFRLGDLEILAKKQVAGEITGSGQDFCLFLSELASGFGVDAVPFDHRDPDLSFVGEAQSVLFLTCHSIEQVQNIPADYFDLLSRVAPRVAGIHFEPFGFQTGEATAHTDRHRFFITERGFNENFYACLRASESDGTLRVHRVETELYDHQSDNPTSLVVWDNAG